MLPIVPVPPRRLDDYREVVGEEAVERLRKVAAPLVGSRLLHVNSTPFGGGVAELLYAHVPLLNDLGIDTTWQVIEGAEDFFTVTKFAHNALQGGEVPWTEDMERVYLDRCRSNAEGLAGGFDFVIVHDPQAVGIVSFAEKLGTRKGRWIWRCHLDLSTPRMQVWNFFAQHVARFDAAVFTMEEFVRPGLEVPALFIIPPSIDPLSLKNGWIGHTTQHEVLTRYGIDRRRPLVSQVSRFDPWKDPVGVIDAYRLAREAVPGLQLLLVGSMARDDPEGWHYLQVTEDRRNADPDIFLLSNLQEVGNLEVNAFQRASTVVVQKSLREGFGLVVSEAMWKEKPVVGGDVGGIRLQIEDGVSGFLVGSVDECAHRLVSLLQDATLRTEMGRKGRERTRERFLTLRELEDHARMLSVLAGAA
jgi:trehalose synthase